MGVESRAEALHASSLQSCTMLGREYQVLDTTWGVPRIGDSLLLGVPAITSIEDCGLFWGFQFLEFQIYPRDIWILARSCSRGYALSCVYIYIYYIYLYIHTYMYMCAHKFLPIHTYMHTCTHACMRSCMHRCTHAYTHTRIHAYMHTYLCANIHTHVYVYVNTTINKIKININTNSCVDLEDKGLMGRNQTPQVPVRLRGPRSDQKWGARRVGPGPGSRCVAFEAPLRPGPLSFLQTHASAYMYICTYVYIHTERVDVHVYMYAYT